MAMAERNRKIQNYRWEKRARNPILLASWITTIPNDAHVFADDLTIKATGSHGIYPELMTFERYATKYQIYINWDKVKNNYKRK